MGAPVRSARRTMSLLGTALAVLLAVTVLTGPSVAAADPPPDITGIAARSGPPEGGQLVRLRGHHLTGTTTVRFGDVDSTTELQVVSDTEVLVRTPPHPVGVVPVAVVRPDATSAPSSVASFQYVAKPRPMVYGPPLRHPGAFAQQLSCTSATFCVSSARYDRNPGGRPDLVNGVMAWNGTRWSTIRLFSRSLLTEISCVTTPRRMCMTVGLDGYVSRYLGGRWTRTRIAPGVADTSGSGLSGVSCATSRFCMAADRAGHVWRYNGTSWSPRHRVVGAGEGFTDLSCPTSSWCYGTLGRGTEQAHGVRYRNGRWDPVRSITTTTTGTATTISCTSPTFCLAAGQFDQGVYLVYTGVTWSPSDFAGPAGLAWAPADCVSPTFCVVPTAQDDFSFEFNIVNGGYLGQQDGQQLPPGPYTQDPVIDCWRPYACMAINSLYSFLTAQGPAPTAP